MSKDGDDTASLSYATGVTTRSCLLFWPISKISNQTRRKPGRLHLRAKDLFFEGHSFSTGLFRQPALTGWLLHVDVLLLLFLRSKGANQPTQA